AMSRLQRIELALSLGRRHAQLMLRRKGSGPDAAAAGPPQRIDLPGAQLWHWPRYWNADAARRHLEGLRAELAWRRDELQIFGRSHPSPRLHAGYGDPGVTYRWSGLRREAHGWTTRRPDQR